ncbi:MAG: glycosyltransferase [Anaerolineae bacterium]|nr:glycosyltransferase [Anaerolineae bacterium]
MRVQSNPMPKMKQAQNTPITASVIIPVYNGAQTLPACLEALGQQSYSLEEIIVVDDGSTDRSVAIAQEFGVRVVSQPNAGPAAARNLGAQVATGDILLFTDADCAPAGDWAEQMVAAFIDPRVAGAKGVYRSEQQALVARFVQQEYQDRYDRMAGLANIDFIDTYSAAYRRDVFLAAGGFDTRFPTASVEDQELSFRLAEQGQRLVYRPQAIVYHQHDQTIGEYFRRKYQIGYWKALVTRDHPTKLIADSHTPQILKGQMGLAALGGLLLLSQLVHQFRGRLATFLALSAWLLLLLSGQKFYRKLWQRDAPVLLVAPWLIFSRAWALGWGFLIGNISFLLKKKV